MNAFLSKIAANFATKNWSDYKWSFELFIIFGSRMEIGNSVDHRSWEVKQVYKLSESFYSEDFRQQLILAHRPNTLNLLFWPGGATYIERMK